MSTMADDANPAPHDATHVDASPAAGQKIEQSGKRYTTVQEGLAYILVPDTAAKDGDEKQVVNNAGAVQQVFYNPIQQFNRDLTVLVIKAYGEDFFDKKKAHQEKKLKNDTDKRKRAAERKAAAKAAKEGGNDNAPTLESDGNNKRKRDENGDEESCRKAAKPDEATSPQESRANVETAENGDGHDTAQAEVENAMDTNAPIGQTTNDRATATEAAPPEKAETKEVQDADASAGAQNGEIHGAAVGEDGELKKDRLKPRFTILDALSATGLRALRYTREIPFVSKVTANDLDPSAAEAISRNVRHNRLTDAIEVTQGNAIAHMYNKVTAHMELTDKEKARGKTEKYDVVDLDPYGTAATFLDAAVQAVRDDGGLLCVTCTDAGVWASNGYPEKCFSLYGGIPIKGWHSHEAGLRLILHAIAISAGRYGLTIEPLLSLSIDFYARVFVKINRSPAAVKFAAGKTMIVYNCDSGCGAWSTQLLLRNKTYPNKKGVGTFYKHQMIQAPTTGEHCEHCGFRMHLAGPMYAGRIHNPEFIKRILDSLPNADTAIYGTTDRIKGMLTTALEEHLEEADEALRPTSQEDKYAEIDPYPFFVMSTQLAKTVHCATPSEDALRGALRGLGYRVTRSHCKPGSIKTDAPFKVLWHVIREWIRQKAPIKVENIKPGSPGWHILGMGDVKKGPENQIQNGASASSVGKTKDSGGEKQQEVVFDERHGREKNKEKLVRYQMNPRENWGPMNRARG